MINQWSITELQGCPDLTKTMATGHFNTPNNWVLPVGHTQTLVVISGETMATTFCSWLQMLVRESGPRKVSLNTVVAEPQ